MSDTKGPNDPSMDDIMASVRKIVSDDEAASRKTAKPAALAGRDDVLLLTDPIEEPDQPLVAAGAAGAAASAFDRLNQAVRDTVPPPAAPDAGPALGAGGKTIEDLVKAMLRPMLKEWLDRNLPPMVERFVERGSSG